MITSPVINSEFDQAPTSVRVRDATYFRARFILTAYGAFLDRVFRTRGTAWRTRLTTANDQPALVAYRAGDDGVFRLHTLQVLTVVDGAVARNVVFQDPAVFAAPCSRTERVPLPRPPLIS